MPVSGSASPNHVRVVIDLLGIIVSQGCGEKMNSDRKAGRRPVIYWATCPDCFTYIWVDEGALRGEEKINCPYCDSPMSLEGGNRLSECCNQLQAILEDIEVQISSLPTAIDIHRFISEQVGHIAGAFNDRLDEIQETKDENGGLPKETVDPRKKAAS